MYKQSSLFLSLKAGIYCFIWGSYLDKVRGFWSFYSSSYFFDTFAHNKYKILEFVLILQLTLRCRFCWGKILEKFSFLTESQTYYVFD